MILFNILSKHIDVVYFVLVCFYFRHLARYIVACFSELKILQTCRLWLFQKTADRAYWGKSNINNDRKTIASMNVRGLGDIRKRQDAFNFLKVKQYNFYCLQDTHFIDKECLFTRSLWRYEWYFSNFNLQSRGVAIIIIILTTNLNL